MLPTPTRRRRRRRRRWAGGRGPGRPIRPALLCRRAGCRCTGQRRAGEHAREGHGEDQVAGHPEGHHQRADEDQQYRQEHAEPGQQRPATRPDRAEGGQPDQQPAHHRTLRHRAGQRRQVGQPRRFDPVELAGALPPGGEQQRGEQHEHRQHGEHPTHRQPPVPIGRPVPVVRRVPVVHRSVPVVRRCVRAVRRLVLLGRRPVPAVRRAVPVVCRGGWCVGRAVVRRAGGRWGEVGRRCGRWGEAGRRCGQRSEAGRRAAAPPRHQHHRGVRGQQGERQQVGQAERGDRRRVPGPANPRGPAQRRDQQQGGQHREEAGQRVGAGLLGVPGGAGRTAKSRPASRPARVPSSHLPSTAVSPAAPAMASAEGSRSAVAESPKSRTQPCMSR